MLLAPEHGHALKDLAQFTVHQKLDIGDWVTRMDAYLCHDRAGYIAYAMNDTRVALEYYVGFLNQYWEAFQVPDVPMTLGGASASAYLMGLGGMQSATYYGLFGLRDREVQWGTHKVLQKGKEDARHYSETLLFRLQPKHASFLSRSCPCCHTAAASQALSARGCVGRPRPVLLHEREGKTPSLKKDNASSRTLASTGGGPRSPRGALMAHE
jgi:hypothetical protein